MEYKKSLKEKHYDLSQFFLLPDTHAKSVT